MITLIRRKLSKNLKTLDETLAEAVEDAAVETPPMNHVKTVLPKNLVTLPKSLATVTIAIDVAADEEARVILLANLVLTTMKTLKKQLLKQQLLKPLFSD